MVVGLSRAGDEGLAPVLPQEVSVAIALGGEQERAVGALERFLSGMGEDVSTERARPRELPEAIWAGDAVRREGVRALLLLTPG